MKRRMITLFALAAAMTGCATTGGQDLRKDCQEVMTLGPGHGMVQERVEWTVYAFDKKDRIVWLRPNPARRPTDGYGIELVKSQLFILEQFEATLPSKSLVGFTFVGTASENWVGRWLFSIAGQRLYRKGTTAEQGGVSEADAREAIENENGLVHKQQ